MLTATQLRTSSKTAILLSLPVILYLLPTDGIFNGKSTCLFKQLLGAECWGCGITRAFFSVLYGHLAQAMEYNPLIAAVFPLSLWLWYKETLMSIRKTIEAFR